MSRSSHNPAIPPRPEMAYMMSGSHSSMDHPPPPPERTTSSSRTPVRKDPPPIPPHPDPGWVENEDLRLRELEEAKLRAAQMEKTMRWWSDCTANWREKWSKVRNERNKLRDECRHLRSNLEKSVKDYCTIKRECSHLRSELGTLKKFIDHPSGSQSMQNLPTEYKDKVQELPVASVCSSGSHKSGSDHDLLTMPAASAVQSTTNPLGSQDDFLSKLLSCKDKDNQSSSSSHSETSKSEQPRQHSNRESTEDPGSHKIIELQTRLEELQRQLQEEQTQKRQKEESLKSLQTEYAELQNKLELSKTSESNELDNKASESSANDTQVLASKEQLPCRKCRHHKDSINSIDSDGKDSSVEELVANLRKELEKLQEENATEWAKQERLQSEKLTLEREKKNLAKELELLQEELKKKATDPQFETDLKLAQIALEEKSKEMSDLRHAYSKIKKALQEHMLELEHAKSRAEQYENDVRKLRSRIDELKQALAKSEDEVDQQVHEVRKLQRSKEELQQHVDNLNVQVQHLQTRLLRNPTHLRIGSSSYDTNDSTTEGATDDD